MNLILSSILCLSLLPFQKPSVSFEVLNARTDATLIAVSINNDGVWVSGTKGTIIRSEDNGQSWSDNLWSGPDSLQFRDIHALSNGKVVAMSIGSGASSQIFTSNDDGDSWSRTYVMEHPEGFLDCIDFWDDLRGVAYGDSFDGYPFIIHTTDGGYSWMRVLPENLPKAPEGEGGFASSGTCVTTLSGGRAWIGTGNGPSARVLLTEDYGQSWKAVESPIISGESAGITSIDFIEGGTGFITGGNLGMMKEYTENCAVSNDSGASWSLVSAPFSKGALYCTSIAEIDNQSTVVVCGPNGIDLSYDLGETWQNIDTANYWVAHIDSGRQIGWAAGKNGRLIKMTFE